ncbi:MAG: sigma 54-interacting transcriptional regulator [Proteobacteria bacterium]|nr:sigma 54-interacting transcriptional regulator [Pseudomonadota bacterium]
MNEKDALPGPLLAALKKRDFTAVKLIYNYPARDVKPYLEWIRSYDINDFTAEDIKLKSPVDFQAVHGAADRHLSNVKRDYPNAEIVIHLSPGTPTMTAIWVLLGKTKYAAKFIQSSVEEGVKDVEIPFDISAEYLPLLASKNDVALQQLMEAPVRPDAAFDSIITQNPQVDKQKVRASQLAVRNLPVLIIGETGTGKELFARAIHNASGRSNQPFLALNCGAIPDQLVDSTLFGHAKGAFTGANTDKKGYFEEADGGTLFLDEFGELPLDAQVRLLRVLQDGTLVRVGETKEKTVNVRIIVATNKDLLKEVAAGRFREDLYYRVAIGILQLPPLRERTGDFGLLCERLLEQINEEAKDQVGYWGKKISAKAKNIMLNYSWPGNIRELYATLLRASLWSSGKSISENDVKEAMFQQPTKNESVLFRSIDKEFKIQNIMEMVAKHYIERALQKHNGNKTKAAEDLGLKNYQTLTNWMGKYGIEI